LVIFVTTVYLGEDQSPPRSLFCPPSQHLRIHVPAFFHNPVTPWRLWKYSPFQPIGLSPFFSPCIFDFSSLMRSEPPKHSSCFFSPGIGFQTNQAASPANSPPSDTKSLLANHLFFQPHFIPRKTSLVLFLYSVSVFSFHPKMIDFCLFPRICINWPISYPPISLVDSPSFKSA